MCERQTWDSGRRRTFVNITTFTQLLNPIAWHTGSQAAREPFNQHLSTKHGFPPKGYKAPDCYNLMLIGHSKASFITLLVFYGTERPRYENARRLFRKYVSAEILQCLEKVTHSLLWRCSKLHLNCSISNELCRILWFHPLLHCRVSPCSEIMPPCGSTASNPLLHLASNQRLSRHFIGVSGSRTPPEQSYLFDRCHCISGR